MDNIKNTEQDKKQYNSLSIFTFALGVFLLFALGILGWYVFVRSPLIETGVINEVIGVDITKDVSKGTFNYTIPGVPFIGAYNHIGEISYITNDADGALASIFEYWNPGKIDFAGVLPELKKMSPGEFIRFPNFKDYVDSLGDYAVKLEIIPINGIKKYINSEVKTPLLFLLPIDNIGPGVNYFHPTTVLIGINEPEQKLIVHSFWLGNNYEISFSDFEIAQKRLPAYEQNTYFVIQPKNFQKALKDVQRYEKTVYPARGIVMNESLEMLKNYLIGWDAQNAGSFSVAETYYERAVNNPKFEKWMPRYFKVFVLYGLAETELSLGKDDNAEEYALMAIELNRDLDKPFEDWPGYEFRLNIPESNLGIVSAPYRVLGDIYLKLNKLTEAKEAYKKALSINQSNRRAMQSLKKVKSLLRGDAAKL